MCRFSYQHVKSLIEQDGKLVLLSKNYKNDATDLDVRCHCGEEFKVSLNTFKFKNKRTCNKCSWDKSSKKRRRKYEDIVYEIESSTQCKVLTKKEDYVSTKKPIRVSCKCGNIFERIPLNIIKGKGICPECVLEQKREKYKHSYEHVQKYVEEYGRGSSLISKEYNKNDDILEFYCYCGNYFTASFSSFKVKKRQCNTCGYNNISVKKTKDPKVFEKEFYQIAGKDYSLVTPYKNSNTSIRIRHNNKSCDFNEYEVKPDKFISGRRCPKCYQSHGEKAVELWLKNNNLYYGSQYKFDDCRFKRPLPFDFVVFNEDGSGIRYLIEYQGEQHYRAVEMFGGEESYKERLRNDKIKKDYCEENGIKLIIIPYTKLDRIEDFLKEAIL